MQSVPLVPHPSTPCAAVQRFEVHFARTPEGELALSYRVEGDISRLRLPNPAVPARRDGLWRHTCFEVFIGIDGSLAYDEFNFAPSSEWAYYRFATYREGMASPAVARPPTIDLRRKPRTLELAVRLPLPAPPDSSYSRLGLTAVIEQEDGGLSYWALAHPPGKPDFHHAAGFVLNCPTP